jgi:hypothetical protein
MIKLITSSFSSLLEVILVTLLIGGGAVGYWLIPDALFFSSKDNELLKFIIGASIIFILEVLLFGPILMLQDIRNSVRDIQRKLKDKP